MSSPIHSVVQWTFIDSKILFTGCDLSTKDTKRSMSLSTPPSISDFHIQVRELLVSKDIVGKVREKGGREKVKKWSQGLILS